MSFRLPLLFRSGFYFSSENVKTTPIYCQRKVLYLEKIIWHVININKNKRKYVLAESLKPLVNWKVKPGERISCDHVIRMIHQHKTIRHTQETTTTTNEH